MRWNMTFTRSVKFAMEYLHGISRLDILVCEQNTTNREFLFKIYLHTVESSVQLKINFFFSF